MANEVLFMSSIICAITHIMAIINLNNIPWLYNFAILRGCTISILNNRYTNTIIQYADRTTMIQGFIINVYYMHKNNILVSIGPYMVCAVISYFAGKISESRYLFNILHIWAHILITATNLAILFSFG